MIKRESNNAKTSPLRSPMVVISFHVTVGHQPCTIEGNAACSARLSVYVVRVHTAASSCFCHFDQDDHRQV